MLRTAWVREANLYARYASSSDRRSVYVAFGNTFESKIRYIISEADAMEAKPLYVHYVNSLHEAQFLQNSMKTQPKSRKFLKAHRPKLQFSFFRQKVQLLGDPVFAIISLQPKLLSIGQIEAARRAIVRSLRAHKNSRVLIRISPTFPKTSTPLETRMGGGKGAVDSWEAKLRHGTILFEMSQIDEQTAREAFRKANYKLPGKYKFVTYVPEKV